MGQKRYFSAISNFDAVVGNSSSGIYEVPSFDTPTINIGDRQKGRPQANSVINTVVKVNEIYNAILKLFSIRFEGVDNPYGDEKTTNRILKIFKERSKTNNFTKL